MGRGNFKCTLFTCSELGKYLCQVGFNDFPIGIKGMNINRVPLKWINCSSCGSNDRRGQFGCNRSILLMSSLHSSLALRMGLHLLPSCLACS